MKDKEITNEEELLEDNLNEEPKDSEAIRAQKESKKWSELSSPAKLEIGKLYNANKYN